MCVCVCLCSMLPGWGKLIPIRIFDLSFTYIFYFILFLHSLRYFILFCASKWIYREAVSAGFGLTNAVNSNLNFLLQYWTHTHLYIYTVYTVAHKKNGTGSSTQSAQSQIRCRLSKERAIRLASGVFWWWDQLDSAVWSALTNSTQHGSLL